MEPVSAKSPAAAAPFSVEKVRAAFPALEREVNGLPVAYLDSGASSQRVLASIQSVDRYERRHHSNVHRGSHTLSAEATEAYEGARATVADHIGAADRREVVFVRNATEAINLVARAWGDADVGAGDRLLLTEMEHHSEHRPLAAAGRAGRGGDRLGADRRRGPARHGGLRGAARARAEAGRRHPRLQRARDREPDRRDLPPGPRGRRQGAGRRRPVGAEDAARHGRAGGRLLRDHRPQALRPDRDRRALDQARPAARDAALPRRRLDDPQGDQGGHDLRRRAGPLRGGDAGDRPGDRDGLGFPLARHGRDGQGARARGTDRRLRPGARRRGAGPAASSARRAARAASARSPSRSRASTPTTSPRSSTATASPSAPATTAPSR